MWAHDLCLITNDVILVQQGVPALDPLVLILQTLIPVLQPLPFGSDAQLTPTCQEGGRCAGENFFLYFKCIKSCDTVQLFTDVIIRLPNIVVPHWDV